MSKVFSFSEFLKESHINEYKELDLEMFSKWGNISDAMFKEALKGNLEPHMEKLKKTLHGEALKAAEYFYRFIKINRKKQAIS